MFWSHRFYIDMQILSLIHVSLLGLLAKTAMGVTDAQRAAIQEKVLSRGIECIQDNPLSADDIKSFKKRMIPDAENAKCFTACLFKKIGLMDDMGKISPSKARDTAKQVFKDDDHLKRTDELIGKCASVNEERVGDGNRGCDRAKLAFGCLAENAPKFGLNMEF